jgi:FdhE protein
MAGGFLRKVFGTSTQPSPEVEDALVELARLASERPVLAGAANLLREILPALLQEPVRENAPELAADLAAVKLAGGLPLLRGEYIRLEVESFRRRWEHICTAVHRHQGGDAAPRLAEAMQRGDLDPRELVGELMAGRPEAIAARAAALDLDAGLSATVLRLSLFPALVSVNAALTPLREDAHWDHGYCPTCGSWPLLGEFRGLEQTRFLRCGWCAAEWELARLRCPFCGTRDHHVLGYFHVEGEEARCRAATCDDCRGYVKMLATLAALSPPQLLVADLATTHLDLAAAERGYAAPA